MLETYQKLAFDNKNETLNKEGINESNAKFTIFLKSIEFVNTERHSGVYIQIKFGNEKKSTTKQNNNFEWNQTFELYSLS